MVQLFLSVHAVAIEVVIGVVLSAVLIIGLLIIVIIALSVVVIKGRKPPRYTNQGTFKSLSRSSRYGFNVMYNVLQQLTKILKRNQMKFMD